MPDPMLSRKMIPAYLASHSQPTWNDFLSWAFFSHPNLALSYGIGGMAILSLQLATNANFTSVEHSLPW
jgi:hypothetical protein